MPRPTFGKPQLSTCHIVQRHVGIARATLDKMRTQNPRPHSDSIMEYSAASTWRGFGHSGSLAIVPSAVAAF